MIALPGRAGFFRTPRGRVSPGRLFVSFCQALISERVRTAARNLDNRADARLMARVRIAAGTNFDRDGARRPEPPVRDWRIHP